MVARFLFDTPVADHTQIAGLIGNTDSLTFGCLGTVFGIYHAHHGVSEIQNLNITGAAAGSENATVTINGNPYTVPLTVGTVQHNAYEISNSLNSQVAEYDFSSNDDNVTARSLLAAPAGSFAFASSTATATWSQTSAGVLPTDDFYPQSEWNLDPRPDLDPTKGNVFQIQMQYLGFGAITFFIEDSASGKFMPVHRIGYANNNVLPSVSNPTFRLGWLSANQGNTVDKVLKGASAAGFLEGITRHTDRSRATSNSNTVVLTALNILTVRNRLVFGGRRNRVEVFGLFLTLATDANKAVIVDVHRGATVAGDLDFSYIDEDSSVVEVATEAGAVTGGTLMGSFAISALEGATINLDDIGLLVLSDEIVTFSARAISGSGGAVTATLIWQEDI